MPGKGMVGIRPLEVEAQQLVVTLIEEKAIGIGEVRRGYVTVVCPDKISKHKVCISSHVGIIALPRSQVGEHTVGGELPCQRTVPSACALVVIVAQLLLIVHTVPVWQVGRRGQ